MMAKKLVLSGIRKQNNIKLIFLMDIYSNKYGCLIILLLIECL